MRGLGQESLKGLGGLGGEGDPHFPAGSKSPANAVGCALPVMKRFHKTVTVCREGCN